MSRQRWLQRSLGIAVAGLFGFLFAWATSFRLAERLKQPYMPVVLASCAAATFLAQLAYAYFATLPRTASLAGGIVLGVALTLTAIGRGGLPPRDEVSSWVLLLALPPVAAAIALVANLLGRMTRKPGAG
jgi:hypothetical protein